MHNDDLQLWLVYEKIHDEKLYCLHGKPNDIIYTRM